MKHKVFFSSLTLNCILMLTLVKLGFAQTNNEFQLTQTSDNFYKKCFRDSNRIEGNRPDMIYCINLEYQQRDKILNQVYQKLRLQLSNTSKELLKDAQLKWISFRDKECDYQRYQERRAIKDRPLIVGACLSFLTKNRTADLQTYISGQISPSNNTNYQAVDNQLNQIYQQGLNCPTDNGPGCDNVQRLQSAQAAWTKFRNANCQFESYHFSTSDNTCLIRFTEQRIQDLPKK